ncbi:MAG: type II toxin-antitoxin system VapC family toxin [Rhodocyclaceae bacterium]|nr:type II toxin-antitoxin system VapC family toxin [Rhodocyclaceae bacterium]MDZ4213191.1 type II toxin-antitoxin system VapC family toxin [Rhodocyclaceae bacterium]
MSWLLDTCTLSEYIKKAPTQSVIQWLDEQDEDSLFLSVVTLGEIEKGILKLKARDARRSQKLTAWLGKVEQRFAGRILPLNNAALHAWAQLAASAELSGQPLPVLDGLIMATAQCHGLTVVTRNTDDFRAYPLVFDPWQI